VIAFVDEYWKIIHRAAGWDALRYWLLVSFFGEKTQNKVPYLSFPVFFWAVIIIQMLLSNRFLTGHDIAQVLVHYEDLVGMAFW
jgi:hypothetical protein